MEDLQVNVYAFFGVVELALVLLVVALVFVMRSNGLAKRVRVLQMKLAKAGQEVPEPVAYDQYLRDEVIRNQDLLERAAASEDDAEKKAAELLRMRKCFLELELEARAVEQNPVEFQDRIAAGISEIIERLRPEPQTVTETVTEQVPPAVEVQESAGDEPERPRGVHDTHDEELDHLRQVINNQQDAMAALRSKLKEHEHELEGVEDILDRLDEFEKRSAELQACLKVLEAENERLKAARKDGGATTGRIATMDSAQLKGLKSMVGKQQETIGNLQNLIRELAPEASKAKELQEAIASIQRANDELTGCVSVLEDENQLLRSELEEIQQQLEQQEAALQQAAPAVEAITDDPGTAEPDLVEDDQSGLSPDQEKRELEIKVQELEALVEFKDAAIEELEKQYNKLEARYLAATGEKQVD
jgi:chromosome segregation ATPase